MNFNRGRTFVAVADEGTVSKAAKRLRITQPALSRQIRDLEQELGHPLFDRIGRYLVLTSVGEELLSDCRRLLGHVHALSDRAQSLGRGDAGILKIAASPVQIESVLSTLLPRYAQRFPNVQVKVIEAVGPDAFAMLERADIHVAILLQPHRADYSHLGVHAVPPVQLLAACHPSYRLKFRSEIDIGHLASYPLLMLDTGFMVRKTFDAICSLCRIEPTILLESRAPSNLLALAEAGHGVAVIPSAVLPYRYRLRVGRIAYQRKPIQEPLSVVWDKRRMLPRYAREFCDLLAAHMRRTFGAKRPLLLDKPAPQITR